MADNDDRAYRRALTAFDRLVYQRDREWSRFGGVFVDKFKLRELVIEECCKIVAECMREQADELLADFRKKSTDG